MTQTEYDLLKDDLIPELCEALENATETKFTKANVLYINSEKVDHKSFSQVFLNLFSSQDFKKFMPLLTEAPSPVYFFEAFRTHFKAYKSKTKYGHYNTMEEIQDFSYEGFIPFISIHDNNQVLFFHSQTGQLVDLDYKTYTLTTEKERQVRPIRAVVSFNPYRPEQIYKQDTLTGQKCSHINTYKKPEWQLPRQLTEAEKKQNVHLPPIIDKFFDHVFPDKRCRNYIFDWLHFALTDRCETYLVLNGAKGIGKGIFAEKLCKALLGKDNHKLAPQGVFDSYFNSVLDKCRMVVFDEIKVDDEEKLDRLKRFINKDQMIERKGQDVGKTVETFNSFIICNNAETDMRISWDDRRFSVADMTKEKLEDVWSEEERKALVEALEDPESPIVRQFGYWLLYRTPQAMKDNFTVWKGAHFYKLCYTSLPEWAKLIVDEVTTGGHEEIDEATLRLAYADRTNKQGRLPNRIKIEDFLKNYKHDGDKYLGDLEIENKTWKIVVSGEYCGVKDNTGIQWDSVL